MFQFIVSGELNLLAFNSYRQVNGSLTGYSGIVYSMIDLKEIRRIPRFSGISNSAAEWLQSRMLVRTFKRGEPIFFENDSCTHFFMVMEGEVKIFKVMESGREVILNIFRTGEAFGEVALIDGEEFPANAIAQEDTSVMTLTRKEYLTLLQRFPEVALSIIRDISLRMRALRRRVEVLGEGSVQARIAQMLRIYGRQLGRESDGGLLIPIFLSRNDIAALVSARIETVIRIMSRWNKEEIVKTVTEGLFIPDLEKFKALTLDKD